MKRDEIIERVGKALVKLEANDRDLLAEDASERSIAARLALYLQERFPECAVDVDYLRKGEELGRLGLSEECANAWKKNGNPFVVPEIIVHRRHEDDKTVLVVEVVKTTQPKSDDCKRQRLRALRDKLKPDLGVLVTCETRPDSSPHAFVSEWM